MKRSAEPGWMKKWKKRRYYTGKMPKFEDGAEINEWGYKIPKYDSQPIDNEKQYYQFGGRPANPFVSDFEIGRREEERLRVGGPDDNGMEIVDDAVSVQPPSPNRNEWFQHRGANRDFVGSGVTTASRYSSNPRVSSAASGSGGSGRSDGDGGSLGVGPRNPIRPNSGARVSTVDEINTELGGGRSKKLNFKRKAGEYAKSAVKSQMRLMTREMIRNRERAKKDIQREGIKQRQLLEKDTSRNRNYFNDQYRKVENRMAEVTAATAQLPSLKDIRKYEALFNNYSEQRSSFEKKLKQIEDDLARTQVDGATLHGKMDEIYDSYRSRVKLLRDIDVKILNMTAEYNKLHDKYKVDEAEFERRAAARRRDIEADLDTVQEDVDRMVQESEQRIIRDVNRDVRAHVDREAEDIRGSLRREIAGVNARIDSEADSAREFAIDTMLDYRDEIHNALLEGQRIERVDRDSAIGALRQYLQQELQSARGRDREILGQMVQDLNIESVVNQELRGATSELAQQLASGLQQIEELRQSESDMVQRMESLESTVRGYDRYFGEGGLFSRLSTEFYDLVPLVNELRRRPYYDSSENAKLFATLNDRVTQLEGFANEIVRGPLNDTNVRGFLDTYNAMLETVYNIVPNLRGDMQQLYTLSDNAVRNFHHEFLALRNRSEEDTAKAAQQMDEMKTKMRDLRQHLDYPQFRSDVDGGVPYAAEIEGAMKNLKKQFDALEKKMDKSQAMFVNQKSLDEMRQDIDRVEKMIQDGTSSMNEYETQLTTISRRAKEVEERMKENEVIYSAELDRFTARLDDQNRNVRKLAKTFADIVEESKRPAIPATFHDEVTVPNKVGVIHIPPMPEKERVKVKKLAKPREARLARFGEETRKNYEITRVADFEKNFKRHPEKYRSMLQDNPSMIEEFGLGHRTAGEGDTAYANRIVDMYNNRVATAAQIIEDEMESAGAESVDVEIIQDSSGAPLMRSQKVWRGKAKYTRLGNARSIDGAPLH